MYALFSSVEIRATPSACSGCGTLDCWKGNALGDGCPTFEYPRAMKLNTYCTMCTECFKTCPSGSMSLNLRPWAADLAVEGKPRADEATLALILLSMTAFHGLTMTPSWVALLEATKAASGLSCTASFTLLMVVFLAAPAFVYAALAWISSAWAKVGFQDVALRFAYALLPIALFYHLAHNAEHFLMEGPRLLSLISDPFGWGWNLFGTARWTIPPLVSLEGLWRIQVLFVLLGHLYSLWITARTARRLISGRSGLLALQAPILVAMVAFSWVSLWLLKQPMEMRVSGQSFVTACASTCASEWRRLCSASECAGGMGLSYLILSPIPARARSHGLRATAGNPRSFSARFSQRRASPSCGRGG